MQMFEPADVYQVLKKLPNPEKAEEPQQKCGRPGHICCALGHEDIIQSLAPPDLSVINTVG